MKSAIYQHVLYASGGILQQSFSSVNTVVVSLPRLLLEGDIAITARSASTHAMLMTGVWETG